MKILTRTRQAVWMREMFGLRAVVSLKVAYTCHFASPSDRKSPLVLTKVSVRVFQS